MARLLPGDLDPSDASRHALLSTAAATAPLALVSAPQATFQVTSLGDVSAPDGVLTLREAIREANATPGRDIITFAPSLRGGTITLTQGPIEIRDDLVIDGDPLDRGAGGIVISGIAEWGRSDGELFTNSPFELRGSSAIEVHFEDLSIVDFDFVDAAIDGESASVDLQRVAIQGIYGATGIGSDGPVTLTDSSIQNVRIGPFGGASGVESRTAISLVDSSVSGIGGDYGFGLTAPEVSMLRSTVDRIGGGYAAEGVSGDTISIVDSTISNINGDIVGGVGVEGKTVSIINSTIANTSDIDVAIRGTNVAITNSTVFDNPVGVEGENVRISNSIFLGNGRDGQSDVGPITSITSNGHNIFGDSSVVFRGAEPGDRLGVDARAVFATGLLADNGGPTQTIVLLDSVINPAIDGGRNADAIDTSGSPLLFDQRGVGFPRISEGKVDIGAFEFQGPSTPPDRGLVVTTLEDEAVANGRVSLREAILSANETPGLNIITFAEEIRGGTIELLLKNQPLVITDDLRIDGDPLDRGADGIVISQAPVGRGSGDLGSAFVARGDSAAVTVTFEDLSIAGLHAGDAAIDGDNAAINLVRSAVLGIRGETFGAGITTDGFVSLVESRIASVGGNFGGAVGISSSTGISLIDSTVQNIGSDDATGLSAPEVSMLRSTVGDMRAGEYAAIGIHGNNILIVDSTISNINGENSQYSRVIEGQNIEIFNSTISDNVMGGDNYEPSIIGDKIRIINSTIANNSYGANLLSHAIEGGEVQISNSILVRNGQYGQSDVGPTTTITSNGHNIFGQPLVDGAVAGDVLGADARLVLATGVLADNGGPTRTIALKNSPTNPALDNADPALAPEFDQRGLPRDATPDIGAFELGPTTLPPLAEGVPVPDEAINGVPRSALTLTAGTDAAISFVDEVAAFQSSLGVYLVGPDGAIIEPRWVFERIEHALPDDSVSDAARPGGGPSSPGDTVLLSDLYDPLELQEGTEFGLFLVADGAARNPFVVFDGGTLAIRSDGGAAAVTDTTPTLVHVAENGVERAILGDIMHTVDAGSPNPLSNTLNPPALRYPEGGRGQALSGLLDGDFVIAFEDTPVNTSDRDFNDVLVAIEILGGGAPASVPAVALESLVATPDLG